MPFASILFILIFLPVVLLVYYALKFSRPAQNVWMLLASLLFYAWGEPVFILVLVLSILMNYLLGRWVEGVRTIPGRARFAVITAVVMNVGILFCSKYLGFVTQVLETLASFLGFQISLNPGWTAAMGVSIFTLQGISYIMDVYRQRTVAERNPLYLGLYLALFPQIVGGPIILYEDFAGQIRRRKESWEKFSGGLCRFVVGLGKLVLLSVATGAIADRVFGLSALGKGTAAVPVTLAWLGLFAFGLHLYHTLSGYSDIAIGLNQMFGFSLRENFDYPLAQDSVTDFWGNWYTSLTRWINTYVFPRGDKTDMLETQQTILRTLQFFLLTAAWYGANWTFLAWGAWLFIFVLIERTIEYRERSIPKVFRHVYTLLVVSLGWAFFRSSGIMQSFEYITNALGINHNGFYSDLAVVLIRENIVPLLLSILFIMPVAPNYRRLMQQRGGTAGNILAILYPLAIAAVFVLSIIYIARGNVVAFPFMQ